MGHETMVIVQAEVSDPDRISEAAKVFFELFMEQSDDYPDQWAEAFLASVAEGKCFQSGNKGTVLLWGGIWNYFREDDFTPWLARLIEATRGEWNTNIQFSWESEQSERRYVKVFWFAGGGELLWAEVSSNQRMHWGVRGYSGPTIVGGVPVPMLNARTWKDED